MAGQTVAEVLAKTLFGGLLVVGFAALAEMLAPKRLAGVFAGAPSVALASLAVTTIVKGSADAHRACVGMAAGALGFLAYCLLSPSAMRRFGPLRGAVAGLAGWAVVTAAFLPVAAGTAGLPLAATATSRARIGRQRPRWQCDPRKLAEGRPKDWLVRFCFGAGTSLLAAVLSLKAVAGPLVGGTFLAFPAILVASLTLVAKEEGSGRSRDDARGATAGALGLLCFAVAGAAAFHRLPAGAVFVLAPACWAAVALGSYALAWLAGFGADEPEAAADEPEGAERQGAQAAGREGVGDGNRP